MSKDKNIAQQDYLPKMLSSICFYVSYIAFVAGQTLGYGSGDFEYMIIAIVASVLLSFGILLNGYRVRDLPAYALLIGVSVLSTVVTHKLTLLLTVLLLCCAKGKSTRDIFKCTLIVKMVSIIALFLLFEMEIFKAETKTHYSPAMGEEVERFSINGTSTNILHLGLCTVFLLLIYLYPLFRSIASLLIMFVINYLFYTQVTHGTAGLFVTSLLLLLSAFIFHCNTAEFFFDKYIFMSVPLFICVFIYSGYEYGKQGWISQLDRVMTGRIAYNHYWLTQYGISLFGNNTSGASAFFDNSVIYLLVQFGLIVFVAVFYAYYRGMLEYGKTGKTEDVLLLFAFLLYSMSESVLPSAVVNPSLFILLCLLQGKRLTANKEVLD